MVTHIEQQSCVWHIIITGAIIKLRLGALPDLRGARNDDMMSENAIKGALELSKNCVSFEQKLLFLTQLM
jgi:hypothetical protein